MHRTSRGTGRLTRLDLLTAVRPTLNELAEFERLETIPPFDEQGCPAWSFEGEPLTAREQRWLELYRKLENSGRRAKTHGRRR